MSRAARSAPAIVPPAPETSGLLMVDKPAGPTSHDIVAIVRRALSAPGAGHLGTLDPPATGLLVVALGAATRCIHLWQGGEKTYEATLAFGVETSTDDLAGEVVARHEDRVDEAAIRAAALALTGEILQVPPMVSALKVRGRRLHEMARAGLTVERVARRVRVTEWTWLEFNWPEARARIRCSGGTYVRALARDLGAALGCGAALSALRRLRSEPFGLEHAVTCDELRTRDAASLWASGGIPLAAALAGRPGLEITAEEAEKLAHGNPFPRSVDAFALPTGAGMAGGPGAAGAVVGAADGAADGKPAADSGSEAKDGTLVLWDTAKIPLALAAWRPDPLDPALGWIRPRVVFPWALGERGR
ncbi:MAG: tRNA pseudouridine(55) synthase TruB [Candidatus Eisenbacteria bacterium]